MEEKKEQSYPIVHLHLYKGKKMLYDDNGKVANENQSHKLAYISLGWKNYMGNPVKGYPGIAKECCKIDVVKVTTRSSELWEDQELVETIKKEVAHAVNPQNIKKLTPEQIEIAELKTQNAEILAMLKDTGTQRPKEKKEVDVLKVATEVIKDAEIESVAVLTDDLKALQAAYEEKFKKPPHRLMKAKTLKLKLAE